MSTRISGFTGKIKVLSSAPTDPVQGDEYYDTSLSVRRHFDGVVWRYAANVTTTSTSTTTTSTSTTTTTTSTSTTTTSTSSTTTSTSTTL